MRTANGDPGRQNPWQLEFPPDHQISGLQALWQGRQAREPVRLDFQAGLPQGAVLPAAEPAQEMCRCQFLINYAARTRLERATAPGAQLEAGSLVLLSADRMAAWLLLFPPVGSDVELTTAQLHRVLVEHGVSSGIDWNLLRQIPRMENRYFVPFPVARGTLPTPGRDGAVTERVPRDPGARPQLQGLSFVDYNTLNLVRKIGEGDVICEITPPTPGRSGCTVTGETLPAAEGRAAEVPEGRNTHRTPDGRFLVADREGHIVFSGRNFHVNAVLHLREEDLAADSAVKFLGDVHIHCDLPAGMSIKATGSVQIDGAVENCSIEAGEHIVVSSGVQGQDQALLYAHKQLYAKYLEHCTVYARQDVLADCIIHCDVYSNGTVQASSGRGVLIGGTIRAAREIRASTVGSKAERVTQLLLGGLPCEEVDSMQLQQELDRIAQKIAELESQPASPGQASQLAKLRMNQYVTQAKLNKAHQELEVMPSPARDRAGNPVRAVCGTVYPGTVVAIGGSSLSVDRVRENCTIGFVGNQVGFL